MDWCSSWTPRGTRLFCTASQTSVRLNFALFFHLPAHCRAHPHPPQVPASSATRLGTFTPGVGARRSNDILH